MKSHAPTEADIALVRKACTIVAINASIDAKKRKQLLKDNLSNEEWKQLATLELLPHPTLGPIFRNSDEVA